MRVLRGVERLEGGTRGPEAGVGEEGNEGNVGGGGRRWEGNVIS